MEIKARLNHLRISPRKVRLVIDVVRKMPVSEALDQLKFMNKRAATPIAKLINSAIANAENTYEAERNNLYIKEIRADEAATLKRWMPRAHGRATTIRKRGSHILVVLDEIKASGKKAKKAAKIEAPVKLDQLGENKKAKDKKKDEKETVKNVSDEKNREVNEGKGAKADTPAKGFTNKVFRRKAG